jgi:hypothetical protein
MTATKPAPSEPEERSTDDRAACRRSATIQDPAPLPGVMDFLGAHVGGELAEERLR